MPRRRQKALPISDLSALPMGATGGVNPALPDAVGGEGLTPEQVWTMAGVSREERASAVRQAWDKLVGLLSATETRFFSHQGVIQERVQVEALEVQRGAANDIVTHAGAAQSKTRTNTVIRAVVVHDGLGEPGQPARPAAAAVEVRNG